MNVERMKYAIKALRDYDTIAPYLGIDKFAMRAWRRKSDCGTSACAGGYLAMLPRNIADGLHLEDSISSNSTMQILYETKRDFGALADFLDLPIDVTSAIFHWSKEHATPASIASELQTVLDESIAIPESSRKLFYDAADALDAVLTGYDGEILAIRNALVALGSGIPIKQACAKT